jgi:hypothetical protein
MRYSFSIVVGVLLLPAFVAAGSAYYISPGTYTFVVPAYGTLTVQLWGGGASGGYCSARGSSYGIGRPGEDTTFAGLDAGGGSAGAAFGWDPCTGAGAVGAGGGASGGDINTVGGDSSGATGGSSPNGGAGGTNLTCTIGRSGYTCYAGTSGNPGIAPGGGGGGGSVASGGGAGGYVSKTYATGALIGTISFTVGSGGATAGDGVYFASGAGAPGEVAITWTDPPLATCSVSLSPNPAAYSYSGTPVTLTWTSTNADTWTYITNVGYLSGSGGSFQVPASATTDYSCQAMGTGGSDGTHAASLTVTPPSLPTAAISASSTSIYTGYPTNLTSTYGAGNGDTVTGASIDQPEGTTLTSTSTGSHTYTFTPTQAGTYTFFARATTGYFTSWTSYASTTITVTDPPHCTPSYSCSGQTIQYTNNICQVSTVTTCVAPAFCSAGSSSCLYPPPSFIQSGAQTGHLTALPSLLPKGTPTTLYWNVGNVSTCSLTGSDGESWTGTSGTHTTTPVSQQTVFTLSCAGLDSSTVNESITVNNVPVFQER